MEQNHTEEWKKVRAERVRWTKNLLRYLPRRSTFQRYRGLKWFADFAFKRPYLWSFQIPEVIPAFYVGWILTFLPLVGLHFPLACVLALLLRANVMILVALQMVSNPLVIGFLWPLEHKIGASILGWLNPSGQWDFSMRELFGQGTQKGIVAMKIFLTISFGGVILGCIFAFITSVIYRHFASKMAVTYEDFVKRKSAKNKNEGKK